MHHKADKNSTNSCQLIRNPDPVKKQNDDNELKL